MPIRRRGHLQGEGREGANHVGHVDELELRVGEGRADVAGRGVAGHRGTSRRAALGLSVALEQLGRETTVTILNIVILLIEHQIINVMIKYRVNRRAGYIRRKSLTSALIGAEPLMMRRTRAPSLAAILEKTSRSHSGLDTLPSLRASHRQLVRPLWSLVRRWLCTSGWCVVGLT